MSSRRREEPLVSVGVPVFNEEASLQAVLDSLLAQEHKRLQIVVCDNASTDATADIALEYVGRDARVEVHRSGENRGAAFNFNRCFTLARGHYFTWASGHDLRLPEAIGKCVEALEEGPGLVLCYPRSLWRYLDGTSAPVLDDTIDTRGLTPAHRLRMTIEELSACNAVHGVIRSNALAATRLFRNCVGSDHVLLAELSLLGEFRQLEEELFIRVENRPTEPEAQRLARTLEMVGVHDRTARTRPYTTLGVEHVRGVWHVSAGVAKLINPGLAAFWFARRWWQQLAIDCHLAGAVRAVAAAWRRLPMRSRSRNSADRT